MGYGILLAGPVFYRSPVSRVSRRQYSADEGIDTIGVTFPRAIVPLKFIIEIDNVAGNQIGIVHAITCCLPIPNFLYVPFI